MTCQQALAILSLVFCSVSYAGAQQPKANPKKDNVVDGVTFKEYTIEFSGVKVTAMLPEGAKIYENEIARSYTIQLNDRKIAASVGINIFDEDNPYPVDDPDAKFIDKRLDRNQKSLGMKFEYIKKIKVSGFAGTEDLMKPQTTKGGLKFDQGSALRIFHLKRTEVSAQVHFTGDVVPEAIIRKVFDSMKIETPGPLRDDPTKIVEDPKGIPTTIDKKVTFRTPGKAIKIQTSQYAYWAYPKKNEAFTVYILEGYFDPASTHEALLERVKNSRIFSPGSVLVKKMDCGKNLGILFSEGKENDFRRHGRAVVVDPGAIVVMRMHPAGAASVSEEKVKQFLESLEIDDKAPALEVWKFEMPRDFKEYAIKEAGVSVCLPGKPRVKIEKDKTTISWSYGKSDKLEDAHHILVIEPVTTTLTKKYEAIKKEIGYIPPKIGAPKLKNQRYLEMTYKGGRAGIRWYDLNDDPRYFTILGDKQLQMWARRAVESEAFFRLTRLIDASGIDPKSNE